MPRTHRIARLEVLKRKRRDAGPHQAQQRHAQYRGVQWRPSADFRVHCETCHGSNEVPSRASRTLATTNGRRYDRARQGIDQGARCSSRRRPCRWDTRTRPVSDASCTRAAPTDTSGPSRRLRVFRVAEQSSRAVHAVRVVFRARVRMETPHRFLSLERSDAIHSLAHVATRAPVRPGSGADRGSKRLRLPSARRDHGQSVRVVDLDGLRLAVWHERMRLVRKQRLLQ